ncbi:MAG: GFA family protein [Rhodospirillales bacterium]|nr:GFA family protein [Rhodospirillales bacterium]
MTALVTHWGGCHCGAVRFNCEAPAEIEVHDCSCSICRKSGYRHLVVPKSRFTLLSGADALTSYRFGTGVAEHLFCGVCGVKSFYAPRSAPDCYSVNVPCLDPGTVTGETVIAVDGANWSLEDPGPPKRERL